MKGVKELKARLKSVGNIKKVTSTMELVATAKMKKLQERAQASRPYAEAIRAMMARIAESVSDDVSPLLRQPDAVKRECAIIIAGDKGLCGAFNANVFRSAVTYVKQRQEAGVEVDVYAIGKRTEGFFTKFGSVIAGVCEEKVEQVDYRSVALMMKTLAADFAEDRYQRVSLVYTWFKSAASFLPKTEVLLPLASLDETGEVADESATTTEATKVELDYITEPDPTTIMQRLIPKSLEVKLFNAVLESLASEFASRRIAMKNATDSATEMIDDLTMEYNKARQAGITGELLEIIAGAEAL